MKRLICIFLCGLLLMSLCACGTQEVELVDPMAFYYLRIQIPDQIAHGTMDSVIAPEIREGKDLRGDLTGLLTVYLAGTQTEICETPFPAGTSLVEWSADGTTLSIILTDEAAGLTGIDLTLACACLTRTCLELGDFETVTIRAESLTLDGKASVTMNRSNLLLLDDTVVSSENNDN